jgi:hypothetical protein
MKLLLNSLLLIISFSTCKKENASTTVASRVDIYLLKSFNVDVNQTTSPFTNTISNAVLADTPIVADHDIMFYTKSETTFKLTKDIKEIIKNYGQDKAYAVTLDGQPVYYGLFHPGYLSSMVFGLATIDPLLTFSNEIKIQFVLINGSSDLLKLDNRNDSRLINSLMTSGRLK